MANACAWAVRLVVVAAWVLPAVEPHDAQTPQTAVHLAWMALAAAVRQMSVREFVQAQGQAAEHSRAVPAAAHYEATRVRPEATEMLASPEAMKVVAHAPEAVGGLSEAAAAAGDSTLLPQTAAEVAAAEVVVVQVLLQAEPRGLPRPMVAVPQPP